MSEYRIVGRFQILGGHELSCIKNIGRAHVNTDTNCLEYRVDMYPYAPWLLFLQAWQITPLMVILLCFFERGKASASALHVEIEFVCLVMFGSLVSRPIKALETVCT